MTRRKPLDLYSRILVPPIWVSRNRIYDRSDALVPLLGYEYVAVETLDDTMVLDPEEVNCLCEYHPEVANLHVHTFFIGTRYVNCLHKSIAVLVVTVE